MLKWLWNMFFGPSRQDIFNANMTAAVNVLIAHGPDSPEMLAFIKQHEDDYELLHKIDQARRLRRQSCAPRQNAP